MTMQISEVQIIPIKPQNGIVAFASLVLDNNLYLGSIAVMTRPTGGYRLVFPNKKIGEKNLSIYHPINKKFAKTIEKEVIKHFEDVMNHDRHDSANAY